jgi:hypothetical protein
MRAVLQEVVPREAIIADTAVFVRIQVAVRRACPFSKAHSCVSKAPHFSSSARALPFSENLPSVKAQCCRRSSHVKRGLQTQRFLSSSLCPLAGHLPVIEDTLRLTIDSARVSSNRQQLTIGMSAVLQVVVPREAIVADTAVLVLILVAVCGA